MADLKLYTGAKVFMNGGLLTEAGSITLNKRSGLNPVFTLARGFSGMATGAGTMEMTIETAVPSADFEINPDPYMKTGEQVSIAVMMAGKVTSTNMFITEADYSKSVNQEPRLSIKLMGPLEDWD